MTIRIHNAAHANVGNVTVTGSWSAGTSGTVSCKTSSAGVCTVSKTGIPKATTSVQFQVTGTALPASAYDPAANHEPDGDSDGTAIVVAQ